METLPIGTSKLISSRLVYGCMRITGDHTPASLSRGTAAIHTAIDEGYTHFDHADIYGDGRCETLFGEILKERSSVRESLLVTSKCGIRKGDTPRPGDPVRYDFSKEYILRSVEGSLNRLRTDHLDVLLLHRPDYLFNPAEVAEAFEELLAAGKVRHFGVSNFRPSQVSVLQSYCSLPLQMNQVEFNIHNVAALQDGTLDQCLERQISPQAWCPLGGVAYPAWGNTFTAEDERRIQLELTAQSATYQAEPWIVILAWILKHPSQIMPLIGSTTPARIKAAKQALDLPYTREDWYRLFEARNGQPVP